MSYNRSKALLKASCWLPGLILLGAAPTAWAQQLPTSPGVNFVNSTTPSVGTDMTKVLDSYLTLMQTNPAAFVQNYQTVITMTQNRTAAQTLAAVHDDRTSQQYSVLNGLGALTSYYMTGAGASTSGTTPQSLTPTTYAATPSLQFYQSNINYLNNASAGDTKFGDGTATPLASAVNFINNTVRNNSSTEPAKRTFERYQTGGTINPLDARYANYNATSNKTGLTTALTANILVPSYLANFTVPAPYANTTQWVQGFTVTQAMIDANNGKPITAPNVGTFDSQGNFTATTFNVGDYVPGIGAAPRPYRVSTQVNVAGPLYQIINSTNPYADGAYPSGHTNSAFTQALGLSFLIPQQGQELLARAADLGNNRILAGMHSPFDVMAGRMEATAIAATNIYAALYDSKGNRLDWTNPANASAYSVYQAVQQTQAYLANACGTTSVMACIQTAQASGQTASDPYGNAAQNKANYTAELTYGFQPTGTSTPLTAAQVPVQAQVLLLTRFPYLTDAQRTDILASTGLPSGYPILSGNTYDGWGQLNLYAAYDGYGAFTSQVAVNMNASLGGYNAVDSWNNDISGTGGLTLGGTGRLTLTGKDTYAGPTVVNGGTLEVAGSITSATTVNSGGTLAGAGTLGNVTVNAGGTLAPGSVASSGTMTVNGSLGFASGSTLAIRATPTTNDRVTATGAVTLGGGTVSVLAGTGTYLPSSRYTILTGNGVSGTFSGATSNLAFLTPYLSYDVNSVALSLNRNDVSFSAPATNGNQRAIGLALDTAAHQATTATGTQLLSSFYQLTAPQAQQALNQLTGASLGGLQMANRTSSTMVGNAVSDAVANWVDGSDASNAITLGQPLGYADTKPKANLPKLMQEPKAVAAAQRTWRIWGSFLGGYDNRFSDAATGAPGAVGSYYGGVVGTDYQLANNLLLGASIGGSHSHYDSAASASSGNGDALHVSLYSAVTFDRTYVMLSEAFSHFSNTTTRTAAGFGLIGTEQLSGSYGANEWRTHLEAGHTFDIGQGLKLTPFAALDYALYRTDAYSERSSVTPSVMALSFSGKTSISVPLSLGARLSGDYALGNGWTITPTLSAAWVHEFNPSRSMTATLVSLPGDSFTMAGPRAAANSADLRGGLTLASKDGWKVFGQVQSSISAKEVAIGGRAGIAYNW